MEGVLQLRKMVSLTGKQWATLAVGILCTITYVSHIVFQQPLIGWTAYAIAVGMTGLMARQAEKYLALVVMGVGIMSIAPVSTKTTPIDMALMGLGMALALGLPYFISHRVYRDSLIHFKLDFRRKWRPVEIGAVVFAVFCCYSVMPLYFATTNGISHWQMGNLTDIVIVFVAVMGIGMWEEFFFVATIFGIFQRYLPFFWANTLQATLFTAFLYQIGFREWIVPGIFLYAFTQGYVFYKYKFLLCNVIIHGLVDLVVFLILYNAVFPGSLPIFLPIQL